MIRHAFPLVRTATAVALGMIVLAAVLLAGCTSQNGSVASVVTPAPSSPASATVPATLPPGVSVTKLEVFHFHPSRQCTSCITVGGYANATLTTYFADDLASGRIVFRHINSDLEENRALVEQYGASGSSLWLGVHTSDGGFYPEENVKVWYRTDDKKRYMNYFRAIVAQRLAGDLSPA